MSANARQTVVIAVGGNALIRDKHHVAVTDQVEAVRESSSYIADLVQEGYTPVITHGNGPQVGFLLRRVELASAELPAIPLDYLGADTQGATGYMFSRSLRNELANRNIDRSIAAVVTQSIVDKNDPAFADPTKPIGSFMDEETAKRREVEDGWAVREDAGRGYRRVVPSPIPRDIVEKDVITTLVAAGCLVVAVGGGGIPVSREESGELSGVEAVIDKDRASALLASLLGVETFVICTAVDTVAINFNTPEQQELHRLTVAEAKKYLAEGQFGAGSMAPKIEAAINFLEQGGKRVIITSLPLLKDAVAGNAGTSITQ
ncbi:carbamate kinase [Actinobaculum sp. 352]|uniref:carbamate kinase n=1 Tax=Actinobaculum sp. 352 TaxID=2490946 RepID=UPI000F7EA673|nr:carbamate kinase [Actinobaculum sp. 352]RTE49812.1 carbamate kinase [Actinobaculum sp. 352]